MTYRPLNAPHARPLCRARGALFFGRVAIGLCLPLVPAGCALSAAPVPPPAVISSSASRPADPQTQARDKRSLEAWSKALGEWAQGVAHPASTEATNARPLAFIDTAMLAARHPAWKLADALERVEGVTVAWSAPSDFSHAPIVPFGALSIAAPNGVPGYKQDARYLPAAGLAIRQSAAMHRQENALDRFLQTAATRRNTSLTERETLLRAALDEDVEASRRLSLDELDPALLSEAEQLELTNLRLKLLKALTHLDINKEETKAEVRLLQAEWQAALARQANARRLELERLGEQRPREQQAAGQQKIDAILTHARQQGEAVLSDAAREHEDRLARDFAASGARLDIRLPAAFLPSQNWPFGSRRGSFTGSGHNTSASDRTFALHTASLRERPFFGQTPESAGTSRLREQVRVLRSQAWRDAQRWAQIAARQGGWRLVSSLQNGAPDRTREALRLLNLS